jgi:hypothetical protein
MGLSLSMLTHRDAPDRAARPSWETWRKCIVNLKRNFVRGLSPVHAAGGRQNHAPLTEARNILHAHPEGEKCRSEGLAIG